MDWVRQNWHVVVGVVLAFGILGIASIVVCSPCLISVLGLNALSDALAETPYPFPSPRTTSTPTVTPSPTPIPGSLPVSEFVTWGEGIRIAITEYTPDNPCAVSLFDSGPAEGAKYIAIHVRAENVNQEVPLRVPPVSFTLLRDGREIARGRAGTCGLQEAWEWQSDQLFPNVSREGWVAFEVPQALNPEEAVVRVESWDFGPVYWRLGP